MNRLLERFETRELRLIMGGVMLLVLALSISYGVAPQWKKFKISRTNLSAVKSLETEANVSTQLGDMRDMVQGLKKAVHGETGALPVRELESYVVGKLQAISWSNSIELDSVRPGQRQETKDFLETTFNVEVTGKYNAVYSWLSELRVQLAYIVIKDFRLRPIGDEPDDPTLKVVMTIASYQSSVSR